MTLTLFQRNLSLFHIKSSNALTILSKRLTNLRLFSADFVKACGDFTPSFEDFETFSADFITSWRILTLFPPILSLPGWILTLFPPILSLPWRISPEKTAPASATRSPATPTAPGTSTIPAKPAGRGIGRIREKAIKAGMERSAMPGCANRSSTGKSRHCAPFRLVLLSPFPLVQFLAVVVAEVVDGREEGFAVGFLFATPDAVDEQKLVAGFREHQRHFSQRLVRKYDVRRQIFRRGDFFAKFSQSLKKAFGKWVRFRILR